MTLPETPDVLIVGAGPAGLAAATVLASQGYSTHVLDREAEAGGIPRHCGHSLYGVTEFRRLLGGQAYARRLSDAAIAAGATIHTQTTVTQLLPAGRLEVSTPEGLATLQARAVLLATGARESPRAIRLIGGTKPGGIVNTGALQGLVYLQGRRPFRRPVILGTELVSFSALLTCRHAGARPVAMIEPNPRLTTYRAAHALPAILGIPVFTETQLTAIHGRDQVTGVTLTRDGTTWDLDCDGVVITGGFRPENALLRASHLEVDPGTQGPIIDQFGRCSDPTYFAAGNLLRPVETAPWCWDEGRRVAQAIATELSGNPRVTPSEPLDLQAPGLAWIVPQRIAPSDQPAAFPTLQAAVSEPLRGTLRYGGIAAALAARPARRISLPLPPKGGPVTLVREP